MADMSKVGKTNRNKGNKFERKLAKYLTEMLGDLWGKVVTARSKSGGRQLGEDFLRDDETSTGALLPYYIDAKNSNTFTPEKWIEEVKEDRTDDRPWVVIWHPEFAKMGRCWVIYEVADGRWVTEWLDSWIEAVREGRGLVYEQDH